MTFGGGQHGTKTPLVAPAMGRLAALLAGFGNGVRFALGLLLLAVVAINVANAAGRYLFGISMTGTDELMVYAMVWLVMIGSVLSLAARAHIAIDLLPDRLGPRGRAALFLIHDLIALAVLAYAARASWLFVERIGRLGTTSMGLGVPMTLPHTALLVGFAGMAVVAAGLVLRDLAALAAAARSAR